MKPGLNDLFLGSVIRRGGGWDQKGRVRNSPDDKCYDMFLFCFDKKLFLKARAMIVFRLFTFI